ncbi:glutamine synthetase family protein [Dongia mobilis]|uniref:glutamine synthetase family protein n=1 Tax=Dongia sp. TaxID=1977262 RepID=UPI0026EBDE03
MARKPAAQYSEFDTYLKRYPKTQDVDVFVHDMNGFLRGKRFPVAEAKKLWESGVEMPRCLLFLDPTGDDLDPGGRSEAMGDPDGTAHPIPGRLAPVPWAQHPTAQVLLQMHDPFITGETNAGKPSKYCPRAALQGTLARLGKLGVTPMVAVELEFYLLDPARDAAGQPQPPKNPQTGQIETSKQPYSMDDLDAYATFIRRAANHAEAQNIPASAAITEYSPGQFEINLKHQPDAVAACDNAVLLKRCVKGTAHELGYIASFMSKPFLQAAGSGMHVHVSLVDKAGKNLFGETGAKGEQMLRHAIGGLQATMAESMAIFGANPNASRRYVPGNNVPMSPEWGYNNRTVAFRIPAGWPKARRIEHRVAGADANPYLAMAAILAGIAHGLEQKLDPGAPAETGDFKRPPDPRIPFKFPAALERLAKAKILPLYIEQECLALYVDARRAELEKFSDVIAPREYDWYL